MTVFIGIAMEECCICFNEFRIPYIFTGCKHFVCANCYPKITSCPLCRNTNIKIYVNPRNIAKILCKTNFDTIDDVLRELHSHPKFKMLIQNMIPKLANYFSHEANREDTYKFLRITKLFRRPIDTITLAISLKSNQDIRYKRYVFKKPCYENIETLFHAFPVDIMTVIGINEVPPKFCALDIHIKYINLLKTIVEFTNGYIMNVIQYCLYINDYVQLSEDSWTDKSLLSLIAKCKISLTYGLQNEIKDIAKLYHELKYDPKEVAQTEFDLATQGYLTDYSLSCALGAFNKNNGYLSKRSCEGYRHDQIIKYKLLPFYDKYRIIEDEKSYYLIKN